MIVIFIIIMFFWLMFKFSDSFSFLPRLLLIFLFPAALIYASIWISMCPNSIMSRYAEVDSELGVISVFFFHCAAILGFFSPLYMYLINKFHSFSMTGCKFLIYISITTVLFVLVNLM